MLRGTVAWKYLIGVAVIFGCAVFVSHQYQHARSQCSKECEQVNPRSIPPPPATKNCNECEQNAERHLPRWYRLFGWPEGITTWAILLTLLAIGEQTHQTRRTADLTERTLIATFRPKVILRSVEIRLGETPENPRSQPALELLFVNIGGTEAKVLPMLVRFEWIPSRRPDNLIFANEISEFSLEAGESKPYSFDIPDSQSFVIGLEILNNQANEGRRSMDRRPVCSGTVLYVDGNGAARRTGFARGWNPQEARFVASNDAEYEYQD